VWFCGSRARCPPAPFAGVTARAPAGHRQSTATLREDSSVSPQPRDQREDSDGLTGLQGLGQIGKRLDTLPLGGNMTLVMTYWLILP
jgi:hypothetical protein